MCMIYSYQIIPRLPFLCSASQIQKVKKPKKIIHNFTNVDYSFMMIKDVLWSAATHIEYGQSVEKNKMWSEIQPF